MKYFLKKGFIFQKHHEITNIIDGDKSILHSFNEVGSFIFEQIRKGADHVKIIERMTKKYKISKEVAEKDLTEFISSLKKKQIIS